MNLVEHSLFTISQEYYCCLNPFVWAMCSCFQDDGKYTIQYNTTIKSLTSGANNEPVVHVLYCHQGQNFQILK